LARGKVLPDDGKAVVQWQHEDQAWVRVVEEIDRVIRDFEERRPMPATPPPVERRGPQSSAKAPHSEKWQGPPSPERKTGAPAASRFPKPSMRAGLGSAASRPNFRLKRDFDEVTRYEYPYEAFGHITQASGARDRAVD
jgi:hypothetical protein